MFARAPVVEHRGFFYKNKKYSRYTYAKEKNEEGAALILLIIGVLVFIPFIILAYLHYRKMKMSVWRRYNSVLSFVSRVI
ncbi:hypothetical protein CWC46_13265 [Prodigiosinella confusarubida]|uniref:Uncharacterized protein n=1 Tax=Serratia sp. (strain ATCC 39006) TaxID=104623 RepID=A0A2I5T812_SERS3|nr:hypothetical protein CWC46_13265 [Serratia sp. ATCC 39006]AUH05007.1 hypothetical protein Ser39006_013270 [Serratia sp. ATCC 39006]